MGAKIFFSCFLFLGLSLNALAQQSFGSGSEIDIQTDDLNGGTDIFTDFDEDIEDKHVMEDERFYHHGRFYSFTVSIGLTSFTGNRGLAYDDDPPTFGLSLHYFLDFQNSFGLGFAYSKHHMFLSKGVYAYQVPGDPTKGYGWIDVGMMRVFFDYRYYIDTANLGTAITYANPYFAARLEYWYLSNKFTDQKHIPDDNGGGLGFGIGGGLEFPIKLKESYINVEFLLHSVHFHDKYTRAYQPIADNGGFGYPDLTGYGYSTMIGYVISW